MQVDFQFGGQDVDDYSFIWRDNQQSSWFVTRVIRVLERCQKVPMDVQIYPFIRVYCCFHSVHAPNHVSETKSVIILGCKHSKETGLGCFGVLEIWRNLRKTVVPFPLRHVTWQSEWRTEWGKASQFTACWKICVFFSTCFPNHAFNMHWFATNFAHNGRKTCQGLKCTKDYRRFPSIFPEEAK